ncbi:MAG: polyprenyl synthetase family protein [Bacteriovoracia bacterium]
MNFAKVKSEYQASLERYMRNSLNGYCGEMAGYHFESGGKRLRGIIPLYLFQVYNRDINEVFPFAAAVEMLHNATLVHDDLQDGDDYRRNHQSVWKKYSPEQAVNCGNYMFQTTTALLLELRAPSEVVRNVISRTVNMTLKVIEGQAQEFLLKQKEMPTERDYLAVAKNKTSGLFSLPILGTFDLLEYQNLDFLSKVTDELGVLFQIQDDWLDLYGKKGRAIEGCDIAEGKISFLVVRFLERASSEDRALFLEILRKPREKTTNDDVLLAKNLLVKTGVKEDCEAEMKRRAQKVLEDVRHEESRVRALFNEMLLEIMPVEWNSRQ